MDKGKNNANAPTVLREIAVPANLPKDKVGKVKEVSFKADALYAHHDTVMSVIVEDTSLPALQYLQNHLGAILAQVRPKYFSNNVLGRDGHYGPCKPQDRFFKSLKGTPSEQAMQILMQGQAALPAGERLPLARRFLKQWEEDNAQGRINSSNVNAYLTPVHMAFGEDAYYRIFKSMRVPVGYLKALFKDEPFREFFLDIVKLDDLLGTSQTVTKGKTVGELLKTTPEPRMRSYNSRMNRLLDLPLLSPAMRSRILTLTPPEVRLLLGNIPKSTPEEHIMPLVDEVLNRLDPERARNDYFSTIEDYSTLMGKARHVGDLYFWEGLRETFLSKRECRVARRILVTHYLGMDSQSITVKHLTLHSDLLLGSKASSWSKNSAHQGYILERLEALMSPQEIITLLEGVVHQNKPLTLVQWDTYFNNFESYVTMEPAWWMALV